MRDDSDDRECSNYLGSSTGGILSARLHLIPRQDTYKIAAELEQTQLP